MKKNTKTISQKNYQTPFISVDEHINQDVLMASKENAEFEANGFSGSNAPKDLMDSILGGS